MSADPSILDTVKAAVIAAAVWFGGESGRIVVAGGAGGFARWFQSERRRIRDGILAVLGGALSATYLWPVPFHFLGMVLGALEKTSENTAMAAFLAGALGMSLVKVLSALVETKLKKGGVDGA